MWQAGNTRAPSFLRAQPRSGGANHRDILAGRPFVQVGTPERMRHQIGKAVRRAGNDRAAESGEFPCIVSVIPRPSSVREGQQDDQVDPARDQGCGALEHLLRVSTLDQVRDQDEVGPGWARHQALAVREGGIDIGPAAKLHAEQHLDGVGELVREVDDRGVEADELGLDDRQRRHHSRKDRRVDHRGRHRPGLVHAQDHLVEISPRFGLPRQADQPFRNDGLVLLLPVTEIGGDGAGPINIRETRSPRTLPAQDGAADGLGGGMREAFHQLVDDLLDDDARGVLRFLGDRGAQADQVRHQMHVGVQRRQEFRLQHHGLETQSLERIALDHLHHVGGKELPDITQPAGDAWRRAAEPAPARITLLLVARTVVERAERTIHAQIALGKALVVIAAERQSPTAAALGLRDRVLVTHFGHSRRALLASSMPETLMPRIFKSKGRAC